jgi:hypothetical protein
VVLATGAFLTTATISLAWASAFSLTQLGSFPLGAALGAAAGATWLVSIALFVAALRFSPPAQPPAPPWDAGRARARSLGFLILLLGPATSAAVFFSMIAYGVLSILAPVAGLGRPLADVTTPRNLACCALQGLALCFLPLPVCFTTVAGARTLQSAEDE